MKVKSREIEQAFASLQDEIEKLQKQLFKSAEDTKEINEHDLNTQIGICILRLERLRNLQKY